VSYGFLDVAITPSVHAVQARMGADRIWQGFQRRREFDRFTENEAAFIADRDSFYMATVSETDGLTSSTGEDRVASSSSSMMARSRSPTIAATGNTLVPAISRPTDGLACS
jgi:hypothetical protein